MLDIVSNDTKDTWRKIWLTPTPPARSCKARSWTRSARARKCCAGDFKSYPNVFFALGHVEALVDAVRAGGAEQPVLIAGEIRAHDRNIIYEATPRYATTRTDEDRWRQFGYLSTRAPVLVNDLDPQLDRKSAECAAFPGDPGAATRLVQENLAYFDAHQISWVLSSFRPGKMLTEYRY